jgi:hypothetical protein
MAKTSVGLSSRKKLLWCFGKKALSFYNLKLGGVLKYLYGIDLGLFILLTSQNARFTI